MEPSLSLEAPSFNWSIAAWVLPVSAYTLPISECTCGSICGLPRRLFSRYGSTSASSWRDSIASAIIRFSSGSFGLLAKAQWIEDRSHIGLVQDAEQHLRHAVAAGESRSVDWIRPAGEPSVEFQVGLVVVMLAIDLLHAHESEAQCMLPRQLDEVR